MTRTIISDGVPMVFWDDEFDFLPEPTNIQINEEDNEKNKQLIIATLPENSGITLVKREIVYDTKELLETVNLSSKTTRVIGVTEDRLKECLKVLLKSNPNTVIESIGYSRKNKEIIFVADRDLDLEEFQIYNSLNAKYEVENKVIDLFDSVTFIEKEEPNQKFDDFVKTETLFSTIKEISLTLNEIKNAESAIKKDSFIFGKGISVELSDENFYKSGIITCDLYGNHYSSIFRIKCVNDDIIMETEKDHIGIKNEFLLRFGPVIKDLISRLKTIQSLYAQEAKIKISNLDGSINLNGKNFKIDDEFLKVETTFPEGNLNYTSPSYNTLVKLESNASEVLERIYVPIDDCPEYLREQLKNANKNDYLIPQQVETKEEKKLSKINNWFSKYFGK